jgi:dTDP-4-amino-4,6-dideoxygalactose transaminase
VHLTPAYRHLGHSRGAFPIAERYTSCCLSLPIYPGIRDDQLDEVTAAVAEFFEHVG